MSAVVKLQVSCVNIRHKLMYVDEAQAAPGMVDDTSDTRIFFCIRTHDSLGPDNESVSPKLCHPGRGCYCGAPAPAPAT